MNDSQERRKFWRATFNAPVTLVNDTASTEGKLDDISLKGALLEMPQGWTGKVGDHCHLRLQLGGDQGTHISMWGKVTHVDGGKVGLLCESIDLDSITHLRRLVELNAGDPALLERELSSLVRP